MLARAPGPECASKQKIFDRREPVFFIRPQALDAPSKSVSAYDGWSSGPIIYSYVGNDPLNFRDPSGMTAAQARALMGRLSDSMSGITASSVINFLDNTITGGYGQSFERALRSGNYGTAALNLAAGTGFGLGNAAAMGDGTVAMATFGAVRNTEIRSGSFSVIDWAGYPASVPKPTGSVVLVQGEEYAASRAAANSANRSAHRADPSNSPNQIHEIQPVKFGGSATNAANKVSVPAQIHYQLNAFWKGLQRWVESINGP